ncbi:hypothetical protein L1987_56566 [Smallanthus sonchifolius]|uniref:Uncharacterized protein n=1 Tax=Smallanthus sonchifolius TaxID=185202 RepID=A0ACB9ECJ0_9ASTR|nr:hypothetical protein L1987_56566 [Smallanthus sonchifolius]
MVKLLSGASLASQHSKFNNASEELYFEDFLLFLGFVCVSGFDKEQALRPLRARLHFPASRLKTSKTSKPKIDEKEKLMQ